LLHPRFRLHRAAWLAFIVCLLLIVALPVGADVIHTCQSCGQSISGAFFETKGSYYHPYHFTCSYCMQPIKSQYTTYRSQNYHNDCFRDHIARRCVLCNDVIKGRYLVDYWGNAYHLRHEKEVSRCDFCDRLITPELAEGGVNFSDGRSLCAICHASAIKKIGHARALENRVSSQLRRIGMDFDDVDLELHLIGIDQMQRIANFRSHDLRGFTDYHEEKNLFGRTRHRQIDVYLLYGMPKVEMIGTLAHELTHVWQFLSGRLRSDPALSEGSCNFAAYWVLRQTVPGEEADYIIESMLRDEDEVYGEGFRRVKKYVEENGISNWLTLMTAQNQTLPR
jgi:hypothetical protein